MPEEAREREKLQCKITFICMLAIHSLKIVPESLKIQISSLYCVYRTQTHFLHQIPRYIM